MSKAQHTPGPWYTTWADDETKGRYIVSDTGVLIADAYPDTALDFGLPTEQEWKTNARLIAAAPALFAALQALLEVVPMCEASDVVRWRIANQAGAAIQQARGESFFQRVGA